MTHNKKPRRRGAMAYVMVLSIIFLMLLCLMVMDLGRAVRDKIEMQDAADASTYAATLWLARGMNAVTATNHHMGEMLSLAVVHKAIAGENADGRDLPASDRRKDRLLNISLTALAASAQAVGGGTYTYPDNARSLRAAETVAEGKLNLKRAIASLYLTQSIVGWLPWGKPIVQALNAVEAGPIRLEWRALDRMEKVARQFVPIKDLILKVMLPAAKLYEDQVVRDVPSLASQTAIGLANSNACDGAIFPARPELPIEQEQFNARDTDHARSMAKTQIVRATFPYVNHHRSPIVSHTRWLLISRASSLYLKWTDNDTTERSQFLYRHLGSTIYVMKKALPPIKGSEIWSHDPRETDELFAVIGMAYRPTYQPFGSPVLKKENRAGLVTYAQGLLYNANPQNPTDQIGKLQAEISWDTLNWKSPASSSHAYEFPEGRRGKPGPPLIEINWQAKLVPATPRLNDAAAGTPGPFGSVLSRITPVPLSSRTH